MLNDAMNRMLNRTTAPTAREVIVPADAEEARQVTEALAEQRGTLARITTELGTVDNQYEERTLDQALGQKVPAAEFTKLENRRESLERRQRAALIAIDALAARMAAWDAQASEHGRRAAVAELERLRGISDDLETQMQDATRQYLETLGAYFDHMAAVTHAEREHNRYSPNAGAGIAPPRDPYVVPESTQRLHAHRLHGDPLALFERWLREPEERQAAAAREVATTARRQEEERKRTERFRKIVKAPEWARPDNWQQETGALAGYPNGGK